MREESEEPGGGNAVTTQRGDSAAEAAAAGAEHFRDYVIERVSEARVCVRCEHPACPFCLDWCDDLDCLDEGPCGEEMKCVYD